MRKFFWISSFAAALVSAHAALGAQAAPAPQNASAPSAALVGIWFGLGEPSDPQTFYIDAFRADGTFNSEYRRCDKAKVAYRQTQSGRWSLTNGVLAMHSDIVNDMPIPDDHSYVIESVDEMEFRARLRPPDPDYLFIEKRIADFEFPPCGAGA